MEQLYITEADIDLRRHKVIEKIFCVALIQTQSPKVIHEVTGEVLKLKAIILGE